VPVHLQRLRQWRQSEIGSKHDRASEGDLDWNWRYDRLKKDLMKNALSQTESNALAFNGKSGSEI
jgi:hypothetical protein